MKIANTADWQLQGANLESTDAQLAAMARECIARGVEHVNVLGDVFERANIYDGKSGTGQIASVAIAAVKRFTDARMNVLILRGNHDQAGAGSADALHIFNGMRRVTIVHEPCTIDTAGIAFICLPWSWAGGNPQQIIMSLLEQGPPRKRVLLHHMDIGGMLQNRRHASDQLEKCELRPGQWGVNRAFLEALPVDYIIGGHYHKRQPFYVGALCQQNFGEGASSFDEPGNPAGFEIWDSETGEVDWIELDEAPIYQTYHMIPGDMIIPPDDEFHRKNHIRVIYDGSSPDPVEVTEMESRGIRVEQVIEPVERILRAEVHQGILSDPHEMLRTFAGTQNPPWDDGRLTAALGEMDQLYAD